MSWRPLNWDKIVKEEYMYYGGDREIFEEGVDAMYEPAYQKGRKDEREALKRTGIKGYGNVVDGVAPAGYLVFIEEG